MRKEKRYTENEKVKQQQHTQKKCCFRSCLARCNYSLFDSFILASMDAMENIYRSRFFPYAFIIATAQILRIFFILAKVFYAMVYIVFFSLQTPYFFVVVYSVRRISFCACCMKIKQIFQGLLFHWVSNFECFLLFTFVQ